MGKWKFIDLSVVIMNPEPGEVREDLKPSLTGSIRYQNHEESVTEVTNAFGCKQEDLPNGLGWANEFITLSTHTGTHMDAPYHYYPTVNGEPSRTIDELPLDYFYCDGVVLDLRHKQAGEETTVEDVQAALAKINYSLKPKDIVCLMFGADKKYGTPQYWTDFPGMSAEATHWIVDHGVRVIGTDAMGFDIPFEKIKEKFEKTGDPRDLWSAHRVGMEKEYYQIEKMANLDQLPPYGFTIACFPIPIYKASAGWVRPVAIIPED